MMKWKARTETTNIGCIKLGNLTFDEDYMSVSIDICDMSKDVRAQIDVAVEAAKVQYIKNWEAWEKEHPEFVRHESKWSGKPVVMDYTYLSVVFEAGKPISYRIVAGFHDPENKHMETCADVAVDLSEYTNELKRAVIKVLLDKFFG